MNRTFHDTNVEDYKTIGLKKELLKLDIQVSDEIKRLLNWRKGRSYEVKFGIHKALRSLKRIRNVISACSKFANKELDI